LPESLLQLRHRALAAKQIVAPAENSDPHVMVMLSLPKNSFGMTERNMG
jgi:hypothetical protein